MGNEQVIVLSEGGHKFEAFGQGCKLFSGQVSAAEVDGRSLDVVISGWFLVGFRRGCNLGEFGDVVLLEVGI